VEVIERTSLTVQPRCQDLFLRPAVLFRRNVGHCHWKAGGEPHAWFSGSSIAFSASIIISILDGLEGLGKSRLGSEFVLVRSEFRESFEALDERELMLTRGDVDEDMTVVVLVQGGTNARIYRKLSHPTPYKYYLLKSPRMTRGSHPASLYN